MLSKAFLETSDYRTLIETSDRVIVVGRRGTGKSALTAALEKYWRHAQSTQAVKLAPEEDQVIGVRPLIQLFGDKFTRVRAGSRLMWRYALMMELGSCIIARHRFSATDEIAFLKDHIEQWIKLGPSVFDRYRRLLKNTINPTHSSEERIGGLAIDLDLTKIETSLQTAYKETNGLVVFLFDSLDEGYEPDDTGIGFVDGLVQAAIDIKTRIPHVRPIVFLRDNIFRAVEKLDPDYSRNIEGHVLRLHWDESALLEFAAKRLKVAFNITDNSNLQVWNSRTTDDLKGLSGFARCLQLTLYRPRDLLAILNEAFYVAGKENQTRLSLRHLESTGRAISEHRLDDLQKEYDAILPGLNSYISVFQGQDPELEVTHITQLIEVLLSAGSQDSLIQQDFLILENAREVLRALYSIGFLGIRDAATGKFIFCHDGRAPDREFAVGDKVLVHPCYWMALNCTKNHLGAEEAQDIYDEYDIDVSSETPAIRNAKISALINQLESIPLGPDGDSAFEGWCHKAIRICFAKSLRNVELKPNKIARQRRDIVATNLAEGGVWKRIHLDYGTRQVTFEVKNYSGLQAADYQQVLSYLSGEYGRLAFFITRDESVDLYAKRDVEWVRDLFMNQKVLVIKLTGKYFTRLLYKLRQASRHDDVDNALHKQLDTYTRLYLAGQTKEDQTRAKHSKKKQNRDLKRLKGANTVKG